MRIFISFFIEGGTCNFLNDPAWSLERWKIFLVYEVFADSEPNASPYCLAGFGTSYKNWVAASSEVVSAFPDTPPPSSDLSNNSFLSDVSAAEPESSAKIVESFDPLQAPSRERISQFLILPPYQHQSHGTHLYNTMTKVFLDDPSVSKSQSKIPAKPLTTCATTATCARLMPDPAFSKLRLPITLDKLLLRPTAKIPQTQLLDPATTDPIRHKYKIAQRQFNRLLEMSLLSTIEPRHRSINRITRKAKLVTRRTASTTSGACSSRRGYCGRTATR